MTLAASSATASDAPRRKLSDGRLAGAGMIHDGVLATPLLRPFGRWIREDRFIFRLRIWRDGGMERDIGRRGGGDKSTRFDLPVVLVHRHIFGSGDLRLSGGTIAGSGCFSLRSER